MAAHRSNLREGNISLALDSYDDLFSDFDPRPFAVRALSHDFLQECRRAVRDKPVKGVEIRLMIPRRRRAKNSEPTIKRRLREHFHKHYTQLADENRTTKHHGIAWIITGITFLLISGRLLQSTDGFLINLLFVITEPAGWFSVWTGFEEVFLEPPHTKREQEFYEKMAKADIVFETY